jgi:hypothetical protein
MPEPDPRARERPYGTGVELLNVELLPIVQIEDPTFRGWQPWTRWKKTTELMQKSIKARTAMLDELGYAEDFSTGYVCRKSLDEPGDEVATMGLARLNRELMSLDDRLRDLDEPDADEPDAEAA